MLLLRLTPKASKTSFKVSRNYSSPFIWFSGIWFSRRSCFAGGFSLLRYRTIFELTTYRCSIAYLLFLFSCTQDVFRHLDIIYEIFWKLISSLDSCVFILYHNSLACCFLVHSENRLWSNLTPSYFSEDTKYFVIGEVFS